MSAVATAAVDPLDVLQRIHQDVKLLRELAGDALVIEIRTAADVAAEGPKAESPSRWAPGARRVLDVFEAQSDEWLSSSAVALEIGISRPQVTTHVRRLVKSGDLEHNGKGTRAARYRFVGVADEQPAEPVSAPAVAAAAGSVAERAERSRVLKDLRAHGSTTALETARRIKVDAALVAEELCWLAANGYVEKPYARYVPIDRTGGAS